MKYKLVFTIMFLFLFLIGSVSAAGTCELDKEFYHPGETATFSCSCTLTNEENVGGHIVWIRNNGTILQTIPINSGLCKTSFFSNAFVFPTGADYLGNSSFAANADGSGIPSNWGGIGDDHTDSFNVSGAHITDCIINDIEAGEIILGTLGSVKITVTDALTGDNLVGARCIADGYSSGEVPILFEPYGIGDTSRISTSLGEVGFSHIMDERFWLTNTSYLFEFHCVCNNYTDDTCYLESSGTRSGFKSCTVQVPFTTETDDLRAESITTAQGLIILGIILTLIITIVVLIVLGIYIKWMPFKIFLISLGSLMMMFTLGYITSLDIIVGADTIAGNVIEMLYVLSTIVILGGLLGLIVLLIVLGIDFFRFRRGLSTKFFGEKDDD